MSESRLHWVDYLVLAISLVLSCAVGVYYGIMDWKGKKNTAEDFLMAGRKMPIIPVAVSLLVSTISSIALMGNPVELYYFGIVFWLFTFGGVLALPIVAHFLAPVFHKMQVVSVNEVRFYTECFQ